MKIKEASAEAQQGEERGAHHRQGAWSMRGNLGLTFRNSLLQGYEALNRLLGQAADPASRGVFQASLDGAEQPDPGVVGTACFRPLPTTLWFHDSVKATVRSLFGHIPTALIASHRAEIARLSAPQDTTGLQQLPGSQGTTLF